MNGALVLVPTLVSASLYLVALVGLLVALRRRRSVAPRPSRVPRVSVLKPLAGHDDDLLANLRSFARIDYPDYEILLGVASISDPAVGTARAFLGEHPDIDAQIVVTNPQRALNPKVAQLVDLERAASGEILVISDSNVRVGRGYLSALVAELCEPGVGLVTSLVAGTGERSLGAAVENMNLGATFAPFVASASVYTGKVLCVGKSMAMWREVLASLGGFSRFGDVLGEDHVLGATFERAGHALRLSVEPVENRNVECTLTRTFERHSRWAKMRRWVTPATFVFEPFLVPILVATLVAAVSPSAGAFAALGGAIALQTAGAFLALRALRGRSPAWYLAPLEILRTYLLFACWLSAWVSCRISWRGHPYRLRWGSRIEPVGRTVWARVRQALLAGSA